VRKSGARGGAVARRNRQELFALKLDLRRLQAFVKRRGAKEIFEEIT